MSETAEKQTRKIVKPSRYDDGATDADLNLPKESSHGRRKARGGDGPGPIGVDGSGEPVWQAEKVVEVNENQALVKYAGWGDEHNCWVSLDGLTEKV